MTEPLEVTLPRAALSLVLGSLAGPVLVLVVILLPFVLFDGDEFVKQWPNNRDFPVFVLLYAWPVFAAGLLLIGIPCWWVFHRMGWRGWRAALVLGFLATFFVYLGLNIVPHILPDPGATTFSYSDRNGMIISEDRLTGYGWYSTVKNSAEMGAAGAGVGLIVWRVAYRRRTSSQPSMPS